MPYIFENRLKSKFHSPEMESLASGKWGGSSNWAINPETQDFLCGGASNERYLDDVRSSEDVSYATIFYYQKMKIEIIIQVLDITKIDKTNRLYEYIITGIEINGKALLNPMNDLPIDMTLFKQELEAAWTCYRTGATNFWEGDIKKHLSIAVKVYFKEDKSC